MSRIVDGAVSGNIPERRAFAVSYPGYPSSVASAVRTLGGDEGLAKARASEAHFLELKFRPDHPFDHPAFGELRHSSNLVLRLSKGDGRSQSGRSAPETVAPDNSCPASHEGERVITAKGDEVRRSEVQEVNAAIIARVEHTYVFEGLADYQYVMAVHASTSDSQKRTRSEETAAREPNSLQDGEPDEMVMLVPPLFSMKDMPEDVFLRPPAGKKRKETATSEAAGEEMQPQCFALDFKIKEIPKESNWEAKVAVGSEPWLRTTALVKLFQERPIWTKNLLNERFIAQGVVLTEYYLRSLLFRIAYYFGNGPFRNLWIRNGYDPRLDPESRAYQMIDFRVPAVLRVKAKEPEPPQQQCTFVDLCEFKAVPKKKFTQFQMIDLRIDDIIAQIESPPERTTCSELTGWFSQSAIRRMRQIMRLRFLALFPGDVARAVEAAERQSLERFKYVVEVEKSDEEKSAAARRVADRTYEADDLVAGEGAGSEKALPRPPHDDLPAMDLITNEEEEDDEEDEDVEEDEYDYNENGLKPDNPEDDEDEEDEDDEEEEEELEDDIDDMQQSQGEMAGLEEPSIFHDYADPAENMPKNYLQALIGSSSFNSSGQKTSTSADLDDQGEYTIFEQDDEDDDDDDD